MNDCIIPISVAFLTSTAIFATLNLRNKFLRYVSTVFLDINNCSAISLVDSPQAINLSTSSSRVVKLNKELSSITPSFTSASISGEKYFLPIITLSIAAIN